MDGLLDGLLLSRIQFAVTCAFHFIFPALSIGLAWLNVIFLAKHRKTKADDDLRLSYFWVNIFCITFVMGVATGVVMVFQFGTNWSEFTREVGSLFGPVLAAEAIIAFFLEATFMGILIWGRNKVSKGLYWASSIIVAAGATISGFLIIAADSWMQTPAGHEAGLDGKLFISDFWALLFNPSTMPRFVHTIIGCLISGAMLVIGISAWYLLKKDKRDFALKSLKPALIVLVIASLSQWVVGHWHTVQVVETQPAKLAAFEGLYETTESAEMVLFGIPDTESGEVKAKIAIPSLLSILATGHASGPESEVQGLNDPELSKWTDPGVPNVVLSFFSYRTMVALGCFFLLFSLWGLFLIWKKKIENSKVFLKIALFAIPLGVLGTEVGWMAAEVGRQPWIIYGLKLTSDAFSNTVPGIQVLLSIILFCVLYVIFGAAWIFLIRRKMNDGPDAIVLAPSQEERGKEI